MADRHIVVVLNGAFRHCERLLPILRGADAVIAADGGANWLADQGITPDLLIGDLDSARPDLVVTLEAQGIAIERHSPHKDETDAELALLRAVALGVKRITVLGALGGRIDHALANISLLAMPALKGVAVTLFDGSAYLWLIRREAMIEGQVGDTLSLLPWGGDARGILTEGLAYPLRNEPLLLGPARGVSNLFSAPTAHVTVQAGTLLAIHTPKAWMED